MADLTEAQKADVYFFCGRPQRWIQVNTALEQAMAKIVAFPAQAQLVTNGLTDSPVGLLAQLRRHYDVTIPSAYRRLQALKVGSIELSGNGELRALAAQGRRLVTGLRSILGVDRDPDCTMDADVFGTTGSGASGGSEGSNWIGK